MTVAEQIKRNYKNKSFRLSKSLKFCVKRDFVFYKCVAVLTFTFIDFSQITLRFYRG